MRRSGGWGIVWKKCIKRVGGRLTLRIFLITFSILAAACALTYGFVAWATPISYSTIVNSDLAEKATALTQALEKTTLAECGPLVDRFILDTGVSILVSDAEAVSYTHLALKKYERAVKNDDDDVEELKADVLELKQSLAEAEDEADALYMSGTQTLSIEQLRRNVTDAQQAYDTAKQSLDAAKKAVNDQLGTYETEFTAAKDAYNNALKAQKATQAAVTHGLEDDLQAIETSKLSADDRAQREELKNMQDRLSKCTVTAPASGTITAVYATEGAAPNGVLFQIENTDALQVDVKIKEYDVNSLKPNMAAIIKADATGDEEYDGYLEKISPSAVRTPETAEAANTANTKDVEFDATVVVSSKETNLRIGMTCLLYTSRCV